MKRAQYWVYILASKSRNLYTGVTNDLVIRIDQHRQGTGCEFTARYNINRLVYVEEFTTAEEAIMREKQIKAWRREKRTALIEAVNPAWDDLYEGLN